jgi:hypothetical protein
MFFLRIQKKILKRFESRLQAASSQQKSRLKAGLKTFMNFIFVFFRVCSWLKIPLTQIIWQIQPVFAMIRRVRW